MNGLGDVADQVINVLDIADQPSAFGEDGGGIEFLELLNDGRIVTIQTAALHDFLHFFEEIFRGL